MLCERRGRILERIVKRCAGLDVHKASVTACVRLATTASEGEEPHQQRRKFSTTTGGLLELRDWLASFEVTLVGMEATGVYWKPLYYMLEDDFELWLLKIERVIAPFCEEEVAILSTIPGVDRRTAETLIAEIGVDMSRFPSSAHLASWA